MPERSPLRVALVVEQGLGHVTHGANLRGAVAQLPGVAVQWLPVRFETAPWSARVPGWSNWTVRAGLRARAALRKAAPADVIFFHTQVTAVLAGGWLRRVPSVISLDATPVQIDSMGLAYQHTAGSGPLERVKMRLNRRALDRARYVIAFSEWTRSSLEASYGVPPERIRVIPPGIDTRTWVPRHGSGEGSRLRILFVGGDFTRKGGDLLLSAFAAIERDDVELHVVTNADLPTLDRVHQHRGLRPNSPELIELFRSSDLFCLPTLGDAFGFVFMEAAACGLPTVATDVGAVSEVVHDGVTGLLVPTGDVLALRRALEDLLDDPDKRAAFGSAARELATRRFDVTRNAAEILEVCRQAAEG